ncbi:MAG: AAA family ATPase [Magnetococcales bacterium]|nr:AAA family ATPase [Magnetococcales bacterium]
MRRIFPEIRMYQDLFGLTQQPFQNTPDIDLFYDGANRGAILEALIYAIQKGEGVVKVVGEVGSGKTMLCRMLAHAMPASVDSVFLLNPGLSEEEVLDAISEELGLDFKGSPNRLQKLNRLHRFLLDRHARNRKVVVLIEEAQNMPVGALEEVRMLSNLETHTDKLMQIVLFGQPELNEILAQREIRQLKERIAYNINLEPFGQQAISDYLEHRLRTCGYKGPRLFDRRAVARLARCSHGLARRVNILADKALLLAYVQKEDRVRSKHILQAAIDTEYDLSGCESWSQRALRWLRSDQGVTWLAALGVLVVLVGVLAFTDLGKWLGQKSPNWFGAGAQVAASRMDPSLTGESSTRVADVISVRRDSRKSLSRSSSSLSSEEGVARVISKQAKPDSAPAAKGMPAALTTRSTTMQPADIVKKPASVTPTPNATVAAMASSSVATGQTQAQTVESPTQNVQPEANKPHFSETPAVVVKPGSGPQPWIESRIVAMRSWGYDHRLNGYSILLMTMDPVRVRWLENRLVGHPEWRDHIFIRLLKPPGKKPTYLIFYGRYAGYSEAVKASKRLPKTLPGRSPYVRDIRKLMKLWHGKFPLE